MKTMKSFLSKLTVLITVVTVLNSCMVTKTQVGDYKESEGKEYTYAKAKQLWIFWGLVPIGRASANTPDSGSCEIVTKYTFADVLISGLTAGIVMTYTIKVNAKKDVNQ